MHRRRLPLLASALTLIVRQIAVVLSARTSLNGSRINLPLLIPELTSLEPTTILVVAGTWLAPLLRIA